MPDVTSPALILLLVALASYLLGSIPFGLVITRALGLGDLRQIGSGNIGATNVLRTGNRAAAAATLGLDAAKGAVAVLLARALVGPDAAQVAALFAFLGHLFPVWLQFRGGKAHRPGQRQQRAKEGGHPLAAAEFQPDRKEMPQKGEERRHLRR
ncbi:MAG: acyl-phosphate glycerol 3-phosphate acyltransferase, partial [Pseudomonadota bacterium]